MIRYLVLAGLLAPSAALAQARTDATVILSENPRARASQERYGYADAVIAGDTVYLSGIIVGRRPDDKDLTDSYARTFRIIGDILKRAGVGFGDVVDITSYHTDIEPQVDAMAKAKAAVMPGKPPAWTAIGVSRLLEPSGITEIKITARRSAPAAR